MVERLIDANALAMHALNLSRTFDNDAQNGFWKGVDFMLDAANAAPTIDAVRVVHGKWIPACDYFSDRGVAPDMAIGLLGVICTACERYADNKYDYCPNCGAKMDADHLREGTKMMDGARKDGAE